MNVAVFGTTTLGDYTKVDDIINNLPEGQETLLLVDGKFGVPNYAKNKASWRMIPIRTYPANYKIYGDAADDIRNKRMVDDADEVYIFYNKMNQVLETIIAYCAQIQRPVYISQIEGNLYEE